MTLTPRLDVCTRPMPPDGSTQLVWLAPEVMVPHEDFALGTRLQELQQGPCEASDVFSLAMLLWWISRDAVPWAGEAFDDLYCMPEPRRALVRRLLDDGRPLLPEGSTWHAIISEAWRTLPSARPSSHDVFAALTAGGALSRSLPPPLPPPPPTLSPSPSSHPLSHPLSPTPSHPPPL